MNGLRRFGLVLPALAGLLGVFHADLFAQRPLNLREALQVALEQNPSLRASQAAEQGAAQRILQARAGLRPSLNYSESFSWGNNPVYVFGSLLEQHRFTAGNFDLQKLNRPDALTNFSSQLSAEQVLYDGRQTRHRIQAAHAGRELSAEQRRQLELDVTQAVMESYYTALLAREQVRVAEQTVALAEQDLRRAEALRDAGVATNADVLGLRVQRAAALDRRLQAASAVQTAAIRLNDAMGVPLDTSFDLTGTLAGVPAIPSPSRTGMAEYESQALEKSPEIQQAAHALRATQAELSLAGGALLPQVFLHGAFAANRRAFLANGGSNWMAGATLRWNLFRGYADRARVDELTFLRTQREQEQRKTQSAVQLLARQAFLQAQSAASRIGVAQAAVAEAEESHRIMANRYEAGLANVTDLLRSQTALAEARLRHLSAVFEERVSLIRLERAAGTLSADSALSWQVDSSAGTEAVAP